MEKLINNEWLIFRCGKQEYGIDILNVQELRGYEPEMVTRVAKSAEHVQGLINLRGQIIPVIDLRIVLQISEIEVNDKTVIVILNLEERMVGVIVDSVSDVLVIEQDAIQPAPKTQDMGQTRSLLGLATSENRLIQLLDISSVIGDSADDIEGQLAG
ncbi:chemotaxis protein CheW [Bordetella sp. 02P26C-1]|uniref:chemotaxis protein CheW n=1 Tax=Bordetella sp. 02P26C-1 TaxID=2683195 RepID=UPI0013556AD3|nr:chemotaxis protein CheW [Bordetella sp. 02P26C-1]MVW78237.1 chemotaxis protein CheW [Bordetella sp. 02P26C-1]